MGELALSKKRRNKHSVKSCFSKYFYTVHMGNDEFSRLEAMVAILIYNNLISSTSVSTVTTVISYNSTNLSAIALAVSEMCSFPDGVLTSLKSGSPR